MSPNDSTITILGFCQIGLPTALGLAELGWRVIGADNGAGKVKLIRAGQPSFYELGLSELLSKHLQSGRFQAMPDVESDRAREILIDLHLHLARMRALMEVPTLIDGRNCLDPIVVRGGGFEDLGLGREDKASAGVRISPGTDVA